MKLLELTESLTIDNNKLRFDYGSGQGVSSKMGKRGLVPYLRQDKTVDGCKIYSVYGGAADDLTPVLLALKKKSNVSVDDVDYQQFLRRSAIFITAKVFNPQRTSIVVTPTSSSQILNDLIRHLRERNPHVRFFPESYVKEPDVSKIEIDVDHPQITDLLVKKLGYILNAAKRTGRFEIKKALPQYRKFFKNFYKAVDPSVTKVFSGESVCVLDDVLSSGVTMVQIIKDVALYGPRDVYGLTLFKTK